VSVLLTGSDSVPSAEQVCNHGIFRIWNTDYYSITINQTVTLPVRNESVSIHEGVSWWSHAPLFRTGCSLTQAPNFLAWFRSLMWACLFLKTNVRQLFTDLGPYTTPRIKQTSSRCLLKDHLLGWWFWHSIQRKHRGKGRDGTGNHI